MLIWTCWLQAEDGTWLQAEDGTTWLEGAMDDDCTAENRSAWERIVNDAAAKIAQDNAGYSMRAIAINVPFDAVLNAFKVPTIEGEVSDEG